MKYDGRPYRTIWESPQGPESIEIIDQRQLPHRFSTAKLTNTEEFAFAIREMLVRGAPLIGVTAAYGMFIAAKEASKAADFNKSIQSKAELLISTRPTAVNLRWAVDKQLGAIALNSSTSDKIDAALATARNICEDDVRASKSIGLHGADIIEKISNDKGRELNILTHCNAGWLATVDYGTATAPIYIARDRGIDLHVWVDETRPRNQGARLTAWELFHEGINHTIIVDNAGGHLMQNGMVDLVIVGTDRTAINGDVANKIGTYLKALAAKDNAIPFYVALPSSTIDPEMKSGVGQIPIEERDQKEVLYMEGLNDNGINEIMIANPGSKAGNYAFDVTPAEYITGLITERGVCEANKASITHLFPEFNA